MTNVIRPDDVRNQNRRNVIAAVRRGDVLSRTEIAKKTGLSPATITAITSDLIDEGVLVPPVQMKKTAMARGRPKVALALNPKAALICSVMFRLNNISAALIDYSGKTISEHTQEIATTNASLKEIHTALTGCIKQANLDQVKLSRIEVGVQGVVDVEGTTMLWSPIVTEQNLPIKKWLEKDFNAPTHISNDCDMVARALNWRDPKRFGDNFAAVLLANGVGMGLILRGTLINGTRSSGTEFGHMTHIPGGALCRCGRYGCIEAYASAYAIGRRASGSSEDTPPSTVLNEHDISSIATSARSGDKNAHFAIEAAGTAIGVGLANMFALVDPFPIALVGSGTEVFDIMETPMRNALDAGMVGKHAEDIHVDCFEDDISLVREGCMVDALRAQDESIADRITYSEAS